MPARTSPQSAAISSWTYNPLALLSAVWADPHRLTDRLKKGAVRKSSSHASANKSGGPSPVRARAHIEAGADGERARQHGPRPRRAHDAPRAQTRPPPIAGSARRAPPRRRPPTLPLHRPRARPARRQSRVPARTQRPLRGSRRRPRLPQTSLARGLCPRPSTTVSHVASAFQVDRRVRRPHGQRLRQAVRRGRARRSSARPSSARLASAARGGFRLLRGFLARAAEERLGVGQQLALRPEPPRQVFV